MRDQHGPPGPTCTPMNASAPPLRIWSIFRLQKTRQRERRVARDHTLYTMVCSTSRRFTSEAFPPPPVSYNPWMARPQAHV